MTTRYQQRLQSFSRSLKLLGDALAIRNPSEMERLTAMAAEKTIRESYHPLLKKLAVFFEEARQ
jgi:hypothetical protein